MTVEMIYYDWTPDSMLEVTLAEPDNFLKVRETLTRIGIASKKDNTLYQSCHILHKQGRYFIVHFKELFALDGKDSNITSGDIERRNAIAGLLQDWDLLKIVHASKAEQKASLSQIKVVSFKEKNDWNLVAKYNIGKKVRPSEQN
jgi:Bacteriophage translational regulator